MSHELNIPYFAYGSNMVRAQMAFRCPGAILRGRAMLPGHRFLINTRRYATIVPDAGHVVHGVLWNLSVRHEAALDRYESVAKGHYYKETVVLELADGERRPAMTYYATDDEPGRPRRHYIRGILESAEYFEFPEAYVAHLRRWA